MGLCGHLAMSVADSDPWPGLTTFILCAGKNVYIYNSFVYYYLLLVINFCKLTAHMVVKR